MAGIMGKCPPDQKGGEREREKVREREGKRWKMLKAGLERLYHRTPAVYGAKQIKPKKALNSKSASPNIWFMLKNRAHLLKIYIYKPRYEQIHTSSQ